jgi:hypothetical protein
LSDEIWLGTYVRCHLKDGSWLHGPVVNLLGMDGTIRIDALFLEDGVFFRKAVNVPFDDVQISPRDRPLVYQDQLELLRAHPQFIEWKAIHGLHPGPTGDFDPGPPGEAEP